MKELKKHQASLPAAVRELWILAVIARFPVWALELITSGSWCTIWRCCGVRSTPPQYPSSRARYSRGPLTRIFQILADIEQSGHPLNFFFCTHWAFVISNNWLYRTVFRSPSIVSDGRVRYVPSGGGNTKTKPGKKREGAYDSVFLVRKILCGTRCARRVARFPRRSERTCSARCRRRRGADDGVVEADGRSRGLLAPPPQCVEDDAYVGLLFGAHTRVSAFRGCAARRPRPEGLLPIEPRLSPPWPPPAALHAICHSGLCFS